MAGRPATCIQHYAAIRYNHGFVCLATQLVANKHTENRVAETVAGGE